MNEVIIAGIFTVIGAILGIVGTVIQSIITAKNNKNMIALEIKKEIEVKKYFEKEKLYSEIVLFLPQLVLAINRNTQKVNLSLEDKIRLNSFKARLSLYTNKELYEEFYKICEMLLTTVSDDKKIQEIDKYTEKLLADLQKRV